jgi:T-complex protein 1 subunit epsilon
MSAQYVMDEYGRPFIIMREQEKKQRLRGIEAHKVTLFYSLLLAN